MNEGVSIRIRTMHASDIAMGMRLKEGAGWNQAPSDWQAYIELEPEGCFVAEFDGRPVATTTAINYQARFGWIGMVIVDPTARRRGIATCMVEHAIAYLESVGCRCQKLDATETGARVYEKMGFTIEYEVQRWLGSGRGGSGGGAGFPDLAPLSAAELNQLDALDATAFGASRRELLQWYCTNDSPRFLAGNPLRPAGYVVGRPGNPAWQMGPLVAVTRRTAEQLMTAFLHSLPQGPVIADVVTVNQTALRLLRDFGFTRQRVLQRMYRGENAWPGRPEETFALAGFEYG